MWKDIIGHAGVIAELKKTVLSGKVPHAMIFAGPEGLGKTLVAEEFFKALNCLKSPGDPCDSCSSCLKVRSGSHPDLVMTVPTGALITVGEIRKTIAETWLKPFEARTRVIVIEPAERMNKEGSNALLKTLEEPPDKTVMILISHKPSLLLPTIVSRCRIIRFTPAPAASTSSADPVLLRLASGTMGGFPAGNSGKVLGMRAELLDSLSRGDTMHIVREHFSETGQDPDLLPILLLLAESVLRDLLVAAHGGEDIINRELRASSSRSVGFLEAEAVAGCIRCIRLGSNENINPRAAASELLIRLQGLFTARQA